MTGGEDLLSLIRSRISRQGPITFHAFMQAALYEPGLGRYCRDLPPMGPEGDYITSPEVDEAFGLLLGRAVAEMAGRLPPAGGGAPFHIVEAGPGRGSLCRDLLAGLAEEAPELHARVRYLLVESSDPLRRAQRELLGGHPACASKVAWRTWEEILSGPPLVGCIVANEFLDALPVHVVEWRGGRLREVHVALDGQGGLVEQLGDPSSAELPRYFERLGVAGEEGQRAEVNLGALRWIREAARILERGYALIVDYGHEATELFSGRHRAGTLLGYRRHQVVADPLDDPGGQDLTAHVDFTSLRKAAEEAGFDATAMTTQRNLLVCTGLPGLIADLALAPPASGGGEKVRKRFALHALMSPHGMGATFKVLLLGRRAEVEGLPCMKDPFRGAVEGPPGGVYTPAPLRGSAAGVAAGAMAPAARTASQRSDPTAMPAATAGHPQAPGSSGDPGSRAESAPGSPGSRRGTPGKER